MAEIDYFHMTKQQIEGMKPEELGLAAASILGYTRRQLEEVKELLDCKEIDGLLKKDYFSRDMLQ